jgi:hypothetical protein
MRKKQYEFYKKLKEDDIPIVREGEDLLTPDYIYNNKRRMKPSASKKPDWELITKRLEKKLEKGILKTIYTMNGEYTPERQLEEVRNNTTEGYKFMLAEKGLLDYLLAYE